MGDGVELLVDLAGKINEEHRLCQRAAASVVEHALRAGGLLYSSKAAYAFKACTAICRRTDTSRSHAVSVSSSAAKRRMFEASRNGRSVVSRNALMSGDARRVLAC